VLFGSRTQKSLLTSVAITSFNDYAVFFLYQEIYQRFPLFWRTGAMKTRAKSILSSIKHLFAFVKKVFHLVTSFVFSTHFFEWTRKKTSFFEKRTPLSEKKVRLPVISERTTVSELIQSYPLFKTFLASHYPETKLDPYLTQTFAALCENEALPPPQILFMQFQLQERSKVRLTSARELSLWRKQNPKAVVFDAREKWEHEWGMLEGALELNKGTLESAIRDWDKRTPIAVYCHYGVRSLDAAAYLFDHGFEDVRVLNGGIDAWSEQVDPSLPRYPGHPC
jgi:rhodanese-related sulfurtransferase